jgi:hypothetical protein
MSAMSPAITVELERDLHEESGISHQVRDISIPLASSLIGWDIEAQKASKS